MNLEKRKMLSVVVSVYNEEAVLDAFYAETVKFLEHLVWDYELIYVNDGSADGSMEILRRQAMRNDRVKVISFSRNFGHEAAMIAGIDHATGDGIVCMDADLQHPPASLSEIVDKFIEGYDVISMIRKSNADSGLFGKLASAAFYRVLNRLSPVKFENNSSDFFALSRPVADILRKDYRERVRYLRGYVQSLGFEKTTLTFDAGKRAAGKSKYNLKKLVRFSINAICSFSDLPLQVGLYSGCFVGFCGLILMIYTIINKIYNDVPAGYSTIIVALCFMFAVTLFVIGIIGEYIAILFQEIKERPIYIVKEVLEKEQNRSQNRNQNKKGR